MGVGAVAHHQRHAPVRQHDGRRRAVDQRQQRRDEQRLRDSHLDLHHPSPVRDRLRVRAAGAPAGSSPSGPPSRPRGRSSRRPFTRSRRRKDQERTGEYRTLPRFAAAESPGPFPLHRLVPRKRVRHLFDETPAVVVRHSPPSPRRRTPMAAHGMRQPHDAPHVEGTSGGREPNGRLAVRVAARLAQPEQRAP